MMLKICDTVDSSVSRKGPDFAGIIKRRTGKLRDAVQKWGTAEAEFSALQGAQVVEIATALKTFEDELVIGYKRAVKTTRTPAMLQSKGRLANQMDRLLARVEEAHVRFRKAIKQAVTEAGQASDLWDDLLETQAFEGEEEEEGGEEDPNVGRTFSMAQSTRSMAGEWPMSLSDEELEAVAAAAQEGDMDAALTLGHMYRLGIPAAPEDPATARVYYRMAAEGGVGEAMQALGSMAEGSEGMQQADDAEAAWWFQQAAEAEHPEGMADWAFCLEQGSHVPRDDVAAMEWYERSAALACPRAANNLGMMLLEGRGGPVQHDMAAAYFQQAADGGSLPALVNLGICYEDGMGLPCDMNAAEDCYSRAAASGHIKASVHLGYLALQQQAWDLAERHFETAAEDGDADALYCLACLAERLEASNKLQPAEAAESSSSSRQLPWKLPAPASLHLPASDTGSYGLFRSASDAGDPRAQHWMAAAKWEAGQDAEAMALFEAAAEQAYVPAQHAITAISSQPQAVAASA
ncbi:hypothetical protein WJX74_009045 [Apatococcus lobatus]|uniref:Uncharacterized protein n=1 Tax=Apatococcus lobatus TaxID=904363 RepID=A0AAW1QCM9_9CHLO